MRWIDIVDPYRIVDLVVFGLLVTYLQGETFPMLFILHTESEASCIISVCNPSPPLMTSDSAARML
jgi:hypothetical protein